MCTNCMESVYRREYVPKEASNVSSPDSGAAGGPECELLWVLGAELRFFARAACVVFLTPKPSL